MLYSEKLEAKESLLNKGVRCPFSYLPDEPAKNTCAYTEENGTIYFLSLGDLYNLVRYGELLQVSDFCVRCEDTGLLDLYDFFQSLGINTEQDVIEALPGVSDKLLERYPDIQEKNSVQKFLTMLTDSDAMKSTESSALTRARSISDPEGEELIFLTMEQVQLFEEWINGDHRPTIVPDHELPAILLGSTFPCPICNFRETHYHGHDCHHVVSFFLPLIHFSRIVLWRIFFPLVFRNVLFLTYQKNGCRNRICKSWYCVKCKSTEAINLAAGRSAKHCACQPIIFCERFESQADVDKYLVNNVYGVPVDSRCGCPICPVSN